MTCDRVLLINIGHFVFSCNFKDIFIPKGKKTKDNIEIKNKITLECNIT